METESVFRTPQEAFFGFFLRHSPPFPPPPPNDHSTHSSMYLHVVTIPLGSKFFLVAFYHPASRHLAVHTRRFLTPSSFVLHSHTYPHASRVRARRCNE